MPREFKWGMALAALAAVGVATVLTFSARHESRRGGGLRPRGKTAVLWVDGGTGSCSRSSAPATYEAATSCRSLGAAYDACQDGDTILVKDGTYGQQRFASRSTRGWRKGCIFKPETDLGATIQKETPTAGASVEINSAAWITLEDFKLNGLQHSCAREGACAFGYGVISESSRAPSAHIAIIGDTIDRGVQLGGGSMISLYKARDWRIEGNIFGPACCGYAANNSPAAITIGKPQKGTNSCASESCSVDILENIFHYATLRNAADWPSSFGAAPEPSCKDAARCHVDSIHIGGLIGGDIEYNQFLGADCTGIYLESAGFSGNDNRNINLIGNTWTHFSDHCDGGIYLKCSGRANGCGGTFNVGFNSGNDVMILGTGWTGAEPGTVVNIYGNYTYLFMANRSGNNAGCMAGARRNVTINYAYNAWLGRYGGGGNTPGPCAESDSTNVTTPSWVNPAGAPHVGLDMRLASKEGRAIDFVPCASLTIGGGCPVGTDAFGDVWPRVKANAGADQAGA